MISVQSIVKSFSRLKSERANFDVLYQAVTDFVMPNRADFTVKLSDGDNRTKYVFKNTTKYAELLTSSILGATSSSTVRWFELTSMNEDLKEDEACKEWFESSTEKVFEVLNSPISNFGSQNHEVLLDWVTYGTGCMYIEEGFGDKVVRFRSFPLSNIYIEEDFMGRVDTVYRSFKLTGRQALQQFDGVEASVFIKRCKERPDDKMDFLHFVTPNTEDQSFPIKSYYICLSTNEILSDGGYNEMPYMVPRWYKVSGEIYGRGPALSALPDIKMVNSMYMTMIQAGQKIADPPLLMADDDTIRPLRMYPGGINYGGIDTNGRALVQPFPVSANMPYSERMIQNVVQDIKEAFYVDQLLVLDAPQMTATEVMTRQEERMRLLSPQLVRLQTEYFGLLVDRVFGILGRQGFLDEFPPKLVEYITANGGDRVSTVEYTGALARSQKAQQAQSLNRLVQSIAPIIQFDPSSLDYINTDETLKDHAELIGFKQTLIRSDEEVAQIRQSRQQAQAAQQMMEMATGGKGLSG
jgi:hypothetical protein